MRFREASLVAVPHDDLRRVRAPHLEYLPRDSNGDWTIPVTCQADARDRLLRIICPDCRDELTVEDADGERVVAGLEDVLATACGHEWAYHDGSGVVLGFWGEYDPAQEEPEIEVPA